MPYKNLSKFLIFIILSLLVNRVVNGQQFIPAPRVGHTATFLEDKIYYIGESRITASNFFYLNLEKNYSWVDLNSQGVKLSRIAYHTSDIGGVNQDSIFIIGGSQLEQTTNLVVQRFDTKTNALTKPVIQGIQGKIPPRREDMRSVNYAGKIYIFSGAVTGINNRPVFYNDFNILDTINLNWQAGSLANAPPPRYLYTATLVAEIIYYIGGIHQVGTSQDYVPMTNIYQYDIIGGTWSLKNATAIGVMPENRIGHSAVLANGNIYIYGGNIFSSTERPSNPQFAMLNTNTLVWSIPQFQPSNIPDLVYHTATLIIKRMLIAFGNITDIPGSETLNNKFYLFDLSNSIVTWRSYTAQELAPSSSSSPQSPQSPSRQPPTASPTDLSTSSTNPVVIGLSASLGAVVLIAGIVAFLFYRYKKKKKKNENDSGHLDIPGASDSQIQPGGDPAYQRYSSQFPPYSNSQNPHYSHTSTQGFSQNSSNYPPGNRAPLHF